MISRFSKCMVPPSGGCKPVIILNRVVFPAPVGPLSAVLLAGGPTRRAKLSEIRVIKVRADGAHITEMFDLQRYMDTGDAMANPTMLPGFTVSVPEQNAVSYQFKNNAGLALGIVTSVLSMAWLVIRIQDR